jgi:hypothetical protein
MTVIEPQCLETIEDNEVTHSFYSMRWFMLLMCQEFNVPDTMRLWDSLLAADAHNITDVRQDDNPVLGVLKYTFIDFVSVALVLNLKDEIIKRDDFSDIMEML